MKKIVSLCIGVIFFLSSVGVSRADDNINITRVSGWDRYETSVNANKRYMNQANGNLAIIASGDDFKTALYGSYMASALKVPFFVNPNRGIRTDILKELKRLNVKRVYVMGTYKTLSKSVDNTLRYHGIKVERFFDGKYVQGYKMSLDQLIDMNISETFQGYYMRGDLSGYILINNNKYADLLSITPFASELAREGAALADVHQFDYLHHGYIDEFNFVIGGYNSVPSRFDSRRPYGRLYGPNRYDTAVEIANSYGYYLYKDIKTVVLVNGENYPDALSSGLVATQNNGAVLLTHQNRLNTSTKEYIEDKNIKNIIIVGGEKSVSKNVEKELRNLGK